MHEAIRTVIQALIAEDAVVDDDRNIETQICEAMIAHDLVEQDCVEELKTFAIEMIRYFVAERVRYIPESPITLNLTLGDEEITIRPDDVLIDSDGGRTLRRIKTGHVRSTESKKVGSAVFAIAAQQTFPDASVEIVYLSDQSVQTVSLSAKELQNRHGKLESFLNDIRAGRFPTKPSARTCPGCPAFFICGPIPSGVLQKNFRSDLPV